MNRVTILLCCVVGVTYGALTAPLLSSKCQSECYAAHEDVFYCSHSRETGYCCPVGSTATECTESSADEVYCSSSIANGTAFMKYTYCPRRTNPCVTGGSVLRPLLNMNQTVRAHETMSFDTEDVCYWEFKVDLESFKATHPNAELKDVFLNLVILN